MNIPTKQLRNGFTMPVFGLGTWMMGGDMSRNPNNDDQADIQAIKNAINAGITHIDTAEAYAQGHAEELVGEAIKDCPREQLFLVSKIARANQQPEQVFRSLEGSLNRLGTDYLDLYLLHAPSRDVPIEETMKAMDQLLDQGLIKNIGVSNFTVNQLIRAQAATANKIVANQLQLNLMYRETEKAGLIDYCQQNDVIFIAWRPLQKGLLLEQGKDLLAEIAKKYGKTPAQIAINWLISQDNIITLSKMSTQAHLEENLGALGWQMEPADVEKLRTDFPNQQFISEAVPLEEWE
jgi:diketogulonate reductase-like aldo/keto reductase